MYKLIIVDDEKSIRNGLCNYFPWEQTGFETPVQFDNGKSALNFLMKNKVHVALTDIRMPVMDGIEFAKQISERN
ncbi:MAG: response regulator, partial [Clostridiaceae bacterium]|nr:response regulator [Clostridiaceae bacterium]